MGRLSDYINSGGRASRTYGTPSAGTRGVIEIQGADEVLEMFDKILSTYPTMDRTVRKVFAKVLRKARNNISKDIAPTLKDDPRQAYRAVKHMVYKTIFGGNVSILRKRKASNERVQVLRPRKLDANPRQRGGNRRKRSENTDRIDGYFASDRGFILRFVNSGTEKRITRYGNRESISSRQFFGRIAPWHMQAAVDSAAEEIMKYVTITAKNG